MKRAMFGLAIGMAVACGSDSDGSRPVTDFNGVPFGATCKSDAECGAGRYCRRGAHGRYCHSPDDECVEDIPSCSGDQTCNRDEQSGKYRCGPRQRIVGALSQPRLDLTAL